MIDSHCHIDFNDYDKNRPDIIKEALSSGVHTIINIGADLQTSRNSVELAQRYDCVYASVGVHPHDAKTYDNNVEKELLKLMGHHKVKAVGEIGLDFYRDLSPRNVQEKVFRRQLEIAIDQKLPIVIHTRDSFEETIKIVREYKSKLSGGVFHCFPGTAEDAHRVIDMGFYISVGGVITYPKAKMAQTAKEVPIEKILLETDSPYLTPVPYRGKTNQPAYVRYVRNKLAELKEMSVTEVEKITDRNSQKMYGLVDIFEG